MGNNHYTTGNEQEGEDVLQQVNEAIANFFPGEIVPYHQPTDVYTYIGNDHGAYSIRMNQVHDP
jgi:hypothetical protein